MNRYLTHLEFLEIRSMKLSVAAAALLALSAGAAVAESASVVTYPTGALSDDDPRVAAFYAEQCESFANQRGLNGIERQDYITSCLANGPAIWPVGEEASSGSEE
jgi:hypothetical protein